MLAKISIAEQVRSRPRTSVPASFNYYCRDQRAVCSVSRSVGRLVCLSTTPVPLRNTARSSRAAFVLPQWAAGFRLRLVGGVALRLRSRRLSVCAPLFPLADRRPKPVFYFPRAIRRCSAIRSNNARVRPTSAASAASFGNAVRYSRTSILLCNPSIA